MNQQNKNIFSGLFDEKLSSPKSIIWMVLLVIGFIVYDKTFKNKNIKDSKTNSSESIKDETLKDVSIAGNKASFLLEIPNNTLTAQIFWEGDMLEKVYYLINTNKIDLIEITITDFCEDYYGKNNKRVWHVKIDKNWMCWDDAKKFETAGDYRHRLSGFYPISNNTEEGEFFCCGRDPGCH